MACGHSRDDLAADHITRYYSRGSAAPGDMASTIAPCTPAIAGAGAPHLFDQGDIGLDLQLSGKTALVTGASMGIGHAIARGLAAEGARLCVTARREPLLAALAARIEAEGGTRPAIVAIDIMADGAPTELAQRAAAALGRVDILVNCAGGSRPPIPLDAPEEEWEEVMRLNFIRVRQLTHAILPAMLARGWGRVVNITGKSEPDRLVSASSAKAAVHAWSKALSRTVGPDGVTVNCIAPGRIMSEQIRRKYPEEFRDRQSATEIPLGRYGEPEELAALAVFLASPRASYITGTVMPVDGGLRRYAF
jgi:3-oxoacyl-[acyl-carrier protein] reductase